MLQRNVGRHWLLLFSSLAFSLVAFTTNKTPIARGYGGAVATVSAHASESAIKILHEGGNAIDAAVAAAATLGVTDPFSCGIGGGGFMMIYLAKDKRIITLDHREVAPELAHADMFLENGEAIKADDAKASSLSVGVPGTVRGWHEALARFGTRNLENVLKPAISVAERGFVIDKNFHRLNVINENKFAMFTSSQKLFLKNGKALKEGSTFKNPDLAKTMREIGARGVRYFYEDKPAKAIVESVTNPPTVKNITVHAGRMSMADLANYETRLRLPIQSTYRGHEIYGMGLPSSGGISVALALNILEGFPLATFKRSLVEHLYLETSRLIFADRQEFLADPEFVQVPVRGLLSKNYAASRREKINFKSAKNSIVAAGDPAVFLSEENKKNSLSSSAKFSEESAHTTHLTVSDKDGNIVTYTFTIEDWGGSGIVVPGFGFLLNNELTDFDFKNSAVNLPAPRKRPRSSMTPTIVLKDGRPVFALGSPGGSTIITTVLQTLVNYFDLKMSLSDALAAPRMSQRNGVETLIEPALAATQSAKELMKLGHKWQKEQREIGAANAIFFGENNAVIAISEPARHGVGAALVESAKTLPVASAK